MGETACKAPLAMGSGRHWDNDRSLPFGETFAAKELNYPVSDLHKLTVKTLHFGAVESACFVA